MTIRALGINQLDVGKIPPIRFKTLSKTAFTLRAQAIARMSTKRRIATLVAWAYVIEAIAIDDALDVLNNEVKKRVLLPKPLASWEKSPKPCIYSTMLMMKLTAVAF